MRSVFFLWHFFPKAIKICFILISELPADSPDLQFGLQIYPGGVMSAEQYLFVNNITIELEGTLTGVENLVIGPRGKVILK